MIVFLCHDCHQSTEPEEGISGAFCEQCGKRLTHFISWKSPEEDAGAAILIERELVLARGGWCGTDRAEQAMKDAGL